MNSNMNSSSNNNIMDDSDNKNNKYEVERKNKLLAQICQSISLSTSMKTILLKILYYFSLFFSYGLILLFIYASFTI